jgi:3-oxoadipate enol-lactonase/2-succinyl-6-hydroxy-2,4-cyclohexadiene-1-carboxylate synthase
VVPGRRRFLAAAGALGLAGCAGGPTAGGPPRERGVVEVNGAGLHYESAGAGEAVVLLHAFMFDGRMWDDQFDVLAGEFRVIRYDARGFGRSALPRPGETYSHVDDLAALLDKLDARNPHLVGAAMGGRFVLDYAVTYPARIRSVAVIDTVVSGWQWSPEWLASYAPVVAAGRRGDVATAKRLWLDHPVFAPAREQPQVAARLQAMVDDYSGWHLVHGNAERPVAPPALDRLGAITVPTLVMVGSRDVPEFQRIAAQVERGVARSARMTVPGAGHVANMEAPDGVTRALRDFLRGA